MIRIAVRATAVAAIAFAAMGLAGTAFADEDTTGGADATATTATAAGLPGACTLLSEDLAQQTIKERADLVLSSTSGAAGCVYQDADSSASYAVSLDVSEQSSGSLAHAREAWSLPGVEIADAPGLGDGAFTGLNNHLDAVVDCAKDGIQYEVEVWAPDGAFAQQQVLTLAQHYCTPDTAAAAPAPDKANAGTDTKAAAPKAATTDATDTDTGGADA